jgi:cytochrome c-type biogenesis protein
VNSALLFAFIAGAVATVNPCGWALLPAWFARRLNDAGSTAPVFAALRAGALATVGFIVIFGLAGSALALGAAWLGPLLPSVGLGVGVVLALVGVVSLMGGGWDWLPGGKTCRRVSDRHGSLVFGVGYGLLSLSCTLPIFLAALGISLTGTPLDLAASLLVYGLGMGTVLSTLGIVAATTGLGIGTLSPRGHAKVKKLSAVLLLAAAAYVIFYWGRVVYGNVMVENPVVNAGDAISAALRGWLANGSGLQVLAFAFGSIVLIALTGYARVILKSRHTDRHARNKGEPM